MNSDPAQRIEATQEPSAGQPNLDFIVDFGSGKAVILDLKAIGFSNNSDGKAAERAVARILHGDAFHNGWRFASDDTKYIISYIRNRKLVLLEISAPREVALCQVVFGKPLKAHSEKEIFGRMIILFEEAKHYEMPNKNKLDRQVSSVCHRINTKVKKKFGITENIINYNGRLNKVSANKKLLRKKMRLKQ